VCTIAVAHHPIFLSTSTALSVCAHPSSLPAYDLTFSQILLAEDCLLPSGSLDRINRERRSRTGLQTCPQGTERHGEARLQNGLTPRIVSAAVSFKHAGLCFFVFFQVLVFSFRFH